jgi:hypothetical protein
MRDLLRDKVATLQAVIPKLNVSTARATDIVKMVDSMLSNMNVGIPARVHMSEEQAQNDDGETIEENTFLVYKRMGGKFRIGLLVKYTLADQHGNLTVDGGDDSGTPWVSLPRHLKLKSFSWVPDLLQAITDSATRLSEETEETVNRVMDVLVGSGGLNIKRD